jgi:hypothetical protein
MLEYHLIGDLLRSPADLRASSLVGRNQVCRLGLAACAETAATGGG